MDGQYAHTREGVAAHFAAARIVTGTPYLVESVAEIHGVDPERLAMDVKAIERAWTQLKQWMPDPEAEVRLDGQGGWMSGTADVLSWTPERCVVLDWRCGWGEHEPNDKTEQIKAYAMLARDARGPSLEYLGYQVDVRQGKIYGYKWDNLDVGRLSEALFEAARNPDRYTPGPHCARCPHEPTCKGREAHERAAVGAMAEVQPEALSTDWALTHLYRQAQTARRAVERYNDLLRERLERGPLTLPDGVTLELVESKTTTLDPARAVPVLTAHYGVGCLSRIVDIPIGKVKDYAGEIAAPRQKGKERATIVNLLRDAGAVIERPRRIIKETKQTEGEHAEQIEGIEPESGNE